VSGPAGSRLRRVLLSASELERCLSRLARAIRRATPSLEGTVLVGVQTRGVPLARRLAALLERRSGVSVGVGTLDITLYRDDLTAIAEQPVIKGTHIPVSIDGRSVILVDDVLYTGRTARAALDELIDFGRPARIQLCVLVDRGHRELPIHADFVGLRTKTARDEIVQVLLREEDAEDRVLLLARARAEARAPRKRNGPARAKGVR
jgi:pyrimidine operon attenuation protein/uracil phosphoribosyltransferase